MKKNTILLLGLSLMASLVIISCSSGSKEVIVPPSPTAYLTITRSPWTISSVSFLKVKDSTDSVSYTSADKLAGSRVMFGTDMYNNLVYQFSDKANTSWLGPNNDTTLLRYGYGAWSFDQNWYNASITDLNAIPTGLLFVAVDNNGNAKGAIYRGTINQLDSTHLQFTYKDTTVVNTSQNTYYTFIKKVSLIPLAN